MKKAWAFSRTVQAHKKQSHLDPLSLRTGRRAFSIAKLAANLAEAQNREGKLLFRLAKS